MQVPPYVLFLMSILAYRVHSIFVLRLFNDPIAMIVFYVALNILIEGHTVIACCFYR